MEPELSVRRIAAGGDCKWTDCLEEGSDWLHVQPVFESLLDAMATMEA